MTTTDVTQPPAPTRADADPLTSLASACAPDRLLGALLGMAVGDALGTTLEFRTLDAPSFPELARGPHCEVVGGGPFQLAPGQVTDDTQMAVCLAQSLVAKRSLDPEDVGPRYQAWMNVCFDIGNQTMAGILSMVERDQARDAGRLYWEQHARRPAGNRTLMRTAPIGVFLATDDAMRRDAALTDSAVTHFDMRCQMACASFDAAIARAVHRQPISPAELVGVARAELQASEAYLLQRYPDLRPEIARAATDLQADLAAAERSDPQLYGPDIHLQRQMGFVRVAYRLAFWQLMHAPSYRDGLIDVVNRGGDADTNGAIAGALLGAYFGDSTLPPQWRKTVLEVLADQPHHPLRHGYHPRLLVQALASVLDEKLVSSEPP